MEGESGESKSSQRRVGLLYDERMCKHHTPDGVYHPENPNRIRAIWNKLQEAAIPQRCVVLNAKEAEDNYLLSVHTKNHVNLIRNVSSNEFDLQRNFIASKFNSIYLNEGSSEAAYLAAGSVIEVAERVAKGELNSAFAVVRPPGHHAEEDEAMGFCLYNNVATAASFLLNERPELGINKILIVDWDVHHGNGTQKMFWKDNRVIFFSVHRHDFGIFYPANDDGFYTMIGEGPGTGYNINVPWENGRCGDADYLAVWDHILLPVAKDFRPDIIIISAGFDAAAGDPLGGCRVTPYGYSIMLKKLMDFAQGKIVLVLEGGYNLESLSNSVLGCMKVLLEDQPVAGSSEAYPFESTWRVIQAVRHELSAFWPTLADELPAKLTGLKAPPSHTILSSDSEDEDRQSEEIESVREDVIERLSKLQVENGQSQLGTAASWRPEFSKIDVWYATFGSNMWKRRFFRYIEGGQVEGMQKLSTGSKDKTLPKPENILWKTYPHRLFFGRESSRTWGRGGTAFLNPKSSNQDQVHLLLYKITLEQFNDVLFQENGLDIDLPSPLFDLSHLNTVVNENFLTLEAIEKGLYNTVLYLGKEQDLPIMTMTCSVSVFNKFKSGELPMVGAAVTYANILKRGLVEGELLSNEEAEAYIHEASTKPL